jgi:integrase
MPTWIDTWKGGRIYEDRDGARRYVIERTRNGRRFVATLPAGVTDPEAELALFKRDPEGYIRQLNERGLTLPDNGAVRLTADEIEAFAKYMRSKDLCAAYISGVTGYLAHWANALEGADLRTVTVTRLYELLDTWDSARNYRVTALQTWCTFLIRRQRLTVNVAALLEVTKAPPSRLKRNRGYSIKQVESFYRSLDSQYIRDLYCVAAKTGMHTTEIRRMARGEVEIRPVGKGGIAAVVRVVHKGKRDHLQSIDAQTLASLQRLMKLKRAPSGAAVSRAVAKVGGTPVFPKYLRHSFSTWLKECGRKVTVQSGGLDHAEVAALIGHRTGLMLKDRYDNSAIPAMGVVDIRLEHPADPIRIDRLEAAVG